MVKTTFIAGVDNKEVRQLPSRGVNDDCHFEEETTRNLKIPHARSE